jgi:hypothetical protein
MRKALLSALLLATTSASAQVGLPWPGPGTPALGGGGGGWTLIASGKACDLTVPSVTINSTGADLIVVGFNCANAGCWGTGQTVSDSQGGNSNTWNFMGSGADSSNTGGIMWDTLSPAHTGASHTITVNNAPAASMVVEAWQSPSGSPARRTGNQAGGQTPGSITPTSGDLVITSHGASDPNSVSGGSPPTGYTISQTQAYSSGVCESSSMAHATSGGSATNPSWTDTSGTGWSYIEAYHSP